MKKRNGWQELRKRAGLTQGQVAKALFVSRALIAQWERGFSRPTIDALRKLCELYGCSADELLREDE